MNEILFGDCREIMRRWAEQGIKAQMCVTSPPYFGLRDYGVEGQIGLEQTPDEYVARLVDVFREVRRVLADDGTLWLNIGDSYAATRGRQVEQTKGGPKHGPAQAVSGRGQKASEYGLKAKNLIGIPWMLAFALRADGWYLRQDIIWHKPNPMPESVRDRCTKAHEYIFLMSKSERYFFDWEAMREPAVGGQTGKAASFKRDGSKREQAIPGQAYGTHRPEREDVAYNGELRNRRSVWSIPTRPYKGAHFATFPPALIEPCILAGSRPGDIVLDPFMGSGTTAAVALQHGRQYLGCELNEEYRGLQDARIRDATAARKLAPAQTSLFDTVPDSTAPDQEAA